MKEPNAIIHCFVLILAKQKVLYIMSEPNKSMKFSPMFMYNIYLAIAKVSNTSRSNIKCTDTVDKMLL